MHGLAAHTEGVGDGLPAPALLTSVGDMDGFEPLLKALQCPHRAQSDGGVGTGRVVVQLQLRYVAHACQGNLTAQHCQETLTVLFRSRIETNATDRFLSHLGPSQRRLCVVANLVAAVAFRVVHRAVGLFGGGGGDSGLGFGGIFRSAMLGEPMLAVNGKGMAMAAIWWQRCWVSTVGSWSDRK